MATKLKKIKIKLIKSVIGSTEQQKNIVKGLGLKKSNQVVEHYASPTIMGMVSKVSHLIQIIEE